MRLEMAKMRKEMQSSPVGDNSGRTVEQRLMTLKELRDKELISPEEYQQKREEGSWAIFNHPARDQRNPVSIPLPYSGAVIPAQISHIPDFHAERLYPEIDASKSYRLKVDPVHTVYVEEGRQPPAAIPVIFLHGGPGSGCNENHRRYFNPKKIPGGPVRPARLQPLDTGLARDEEQFNLGTVAGPSNASGEHLGIEQWLVFGGSWGRYPGPAVCTVTPVSGAGHGPARRLPGPAKRPGLVRQERRQHDLSRTTGRRFYGHHSGSPNGTTS